MLPTKNEIYTFANRDLSWLSFNQRILEEAGNDAVPLMERIRFLSIYSSNLDEFYRVRMPVMMPYVRESAQALVRAQQQQFGEVMADGILPALTAQGIHWIYQQPIPDFLTPKVRDIFFNEVLTYLLSEPLGIPERPFFAANNKLYLAVVLLQEHAERVEMLGVPSDVLPRFYSLFHDGQRYILYIDDIIKHHLPDLYPAATIVDAYQVKVTRDAELHLEEEVEEDVVTMIERELAHRDEGFATRLLLAPGMPLRQVYQLIYSLNLGEANVVQGGRYHNLKDLVHFPSVDGNLKYTPWPALDRLSLVGTERLHERISKADVLLHPPYDQYEPVLRFFNEAAHDAEVAHIYCTLYRVAASSQIVEALITAAKNGKKVTVMLELKARFDEANNIKWAKRMKAVGIDLLYSSLKLKVHAKLALVQRKNRPDLGLLATGNLNEVTARFYTDHVLLTAKPDLTAELRKLFVFLGTKKRDQDQMKPMVRFDRLLVAQFNLQNRFFELIDREIAHAKKGLPSGITIKMNNLEERLLISKLYEASNAGVPIRLLVRSICCLVAGIAGQSEHIIRKRVVGRYLEHGRIFIFRNNDCPDVFLGSADWMNRNVYRRIEVCFPVDNKSFQKEIIEMMDLQFAVGAEDSQLNVYKYLSEKQKPLNE